MPTRCNWSRRCCEAQMINQQPGWRNSAVMFLHETSIFKMDWINVEQFGLEPSWSLLNTQAGVANQTAIIFRLWERQINSVTILKGHTSGAFPFIFDSNSRVLASTNSKGRLLIHQLEGLAQWQELLRRSCRWVEAYLANSQSAEAEAKRICKTVQNNGP